MLYEVITRSSLKTYQRDLSLYLKEYFNINELEMNETNIQADPAKIASELALRANNRIILYSADGEFLSDSANVEGRIIYFEGYNKDYAKSKNKGMGSFNFGQEGDSRITSYNVCYTKLLRVYNAVQALFKILFGLGLWGE